MEEKKTNWKKGCLIGCVVTFVLGLICVVVLFLAMGKIISFAATKVGEKIQTEIEQKLPEGYDKQKVRDGFQDGFQALQEGRINKMEVQAIGDYANEILADDEITTEEMDRFLEMIETSSQE